VLQRPHDRLLRRRAVNRGMELLAWLAAATAVFFLGVVIYSVAQRGASQLSFDFLTKSQLQFAPPNVKQGLANAFAGSLVIVGLATVMALPVGILIAIYVNEFAPRAIKSAVGLTLDVLAGVPAIVIGFFVFGLIVISHGQSALAASFALAVLMLPLVARSTIEVLALVPDSLREAALGVGAPRWRTVVGIVLPQTANFVTVAPIGDGRGNLHPQVIGQAVAFVCSHACVLLSTAASSLSKASSNNRTPSSVSLSVT